MVETTVVPSAHRRPCVIRVAKDGMTAWARLALDESAAAVTFSIVRDALAAAGVIKGILAHEIEQAIIANSRDEIIVAQGQSPFPGADARFEYLLESTQARAPRIDANDIADYRELGVLTMVRPGDALIRRTPASEGVHGFDVRGREIRAKRGKDRPFARNLSGVTSVSGDPDLLVASIAGHLRHVPDGVVVDPVLLVSQVDMVSGNIEFDGDVRVAGDVKTEMRVRATGTVVISGTVEAAEVEAGGDVIIMGGVLGRNEARASSSPSESSRSRVRAGGTIRARFAESAVLEAGVDVFITDFSLNSLLVGLGKAVVGMSPGSDGRIIGGSVRATSLVQAVSVGSTSGVQTKICAGVNPRSEQIARKARMELLSLEEQVDGVKKLLAFFEVHPERERDGLRSKAEDTMAMLLRKTTQLRAQVGLAEAALMMAAQASIHVRDIIHAGAEIQFGVLTLAICEDERECQFLVRAGKVLREALPAN